MATGFFVFAISTVMPFESIGVMTMKMIRRTSMTSTIGVTLMSATGSDAFIFFISSSPQTLNGPLNSFGAGPAVPQGTAGSIQLANLVAATTTYGQRDWRASGSSRST